MRRRRSLEERDGYRDGFWHGVEWTTVLVAAITFVFFFLTACAPLEPQRPPEIRTTTVEVRVPVPVPCFTESERPVLAPPTPIDIDRATVDQMAAAIAADDLADQLFARAVDALFILCQKRIADGTATQPVGK